jgi:hypothetical protein
MMAGVRRRHAAPTSVLSISHRLMAPAVALVAGRECNGSEMLTAAQAFIYDTSRGIRMVPQYIF